MPLVRTGRLSRSVSACLLLANLSSFGLVEGPASALPGEGGLTTTGAQFFSNENLLFYRPEIEDHFAWAITTGDFNRDGAADLATGVPHDNGLFGFELEDCGAVVVRYGVPGVGLAIGPATTFLNQIPGGSPDRAEAGDNFGAALASCDFNHDGFDDLAVGVPNEDFGAVPDAGAVDIYYGSRAGLSLVAATHLTQSSRGIPGTPERGDLFGFSLACGDFDRDQFDDLAIGIPEETFEGDAWHGGSTVVVHGSPIGLNTEQSVTLNQESDGADGVAEYDDRFGWSLAAGDFDDDGFADLAVGVVGEDNSSADPRGRGAVQVFFGSFWFVDDARDVLWTESELGGNSEAGDRMGWSLAAGDFDGDDFDDLAIGVPFKDLHIGGVFGGGRVLVVHGGLAGFDLGRTQFWTQDLLPGTESTASGDRFGFALVTGDFDADGRDDLAIGHPGERSPQANFENFGATSVILGTVAGLSLGRSVTFREGYGGVPGGEGGDDDIEFGRALASGDFDADGVDDLAIGKPGTAYRALWDIGGETVLYGSRFGSE